MLLFASLFQPFPTGFVSHSDKEQQLCSEGVMVEGNFSRSIPPIVGLPLLAPRVTLETSPFPWRPVPASHSWGQPEVVAKARAWGWPSSQGPNLSWLESRGQ